MPDWITIKEAPELSGDDIPPVRRLAGQGKSRAEKNIIIALN